MREAKERIIYSNYYSDELFDYAREWLKEVHRDDYPNDNNYEPLDEDIWNEYYFLQEISWNDEREMLKDYFDGGTFVLQGTITRWNGRCLGGFVFGSFDELYKVWRDCDFMKLYDENGHFFIECSHHDGTNIFEVRELNDKGCEYYDKHYYDEDSNTHNQLMTSKYSHLPHYAHKMWGCKKREYDKTALGGK